MAGHVKVLAWLHLVIGAIGLAVGVLVAMFFGGLAGFVGATDPTDGARVAMPILGGIGGIVFVIAAVISVPGMIAGYGLLQFRPWARILAIIVSVIDLLHVPIGTALGFYGLWVLLSREGEALFRQPPGAYAPGYGAAPPGPGVPR